MKKLLWMLLCTPIAVCAANETDAAKAVLKRIGADDVKIRFEKIDKENGCDRYDVTPGDETVIKGSSSVAMCHGFYDYMKRNNGGIISWSGSRISIPASASKSAPFKVTSPVPHHYYLNVVTYGYTMPYWTWDRWEKELDWMALHGIDMPLALVANEAIGTRVWEKLGLTDSEISEFYVGPAYLPWQRMGNIINHSIPLTDEWHADQIALQKKILARMRELGMKPICPAFAGFVPRGIKRLYPDVKINLLRWGGFPEKNRASILAPTDPLFMTIGKRFIEEWEKEFGQCGYYLADMFNEMELPVPKDDKAKRHELMAAFGEVGYKSITAANPDAVWVMQGWMFGYHRNIWDAETLKAMLSKIPDDKILLLDLAVDYSKVRWRHDGNWDFYNAFFGKPWIYSVIPNMGGKSLHTGPIEFYANGHLAALESKNRGKLAGIGMAPEGIENNEMLYELLTDVAWKSTETKIEDWFENYAVNRYGTCTKELKLYFDKMSKSVYAGLDDHPRYNWQRRPAGHGFVVDAMYREALKTFASAAGNGTLKQSRLYAVDLAENTAFYIGAKMQELLSGMQEALVNGDKEIAQKFFAQFKTLALGADELLIDHPSLSLEKWVAFARSHGKDDAARALHEEDAKRLITIWGPPIDDYSARVWSGMIKDYYLKRVELWLQMRLGEATEKQVRDFELGWYKKPLEKPMRAMVVRSPEQVIEMSRKLIETADAVKVELPKQQKLAQWTPDRVSTDWQEVDFDFEREHLNEMKGVRFVYRKGAHRLDIRKVSIYADGDLIAECEQQGTTGLENKNNVFKLDIPEDPAANNTLLIRAEIRTEGGNDSYGDILLVK